MAKTETAILAGGCFWCTEAIFKRLKGVKSVIPGYSGGMTESPSYEDVLGGESGHVEAVKIEVDPKIINYKEILDIFWHTHDPTSKNRQGNDIGPQYQSVIFYMNEKQKKTAKDLEQELENKNEFKKSIITKIIPYTNFFKAEDYHQNYYENNNSQPYCHFVITPKVRKLFSNYKNNIKKEYDMEQT